MGKMLFESRTTKKIMQMKIVVTVLINLVIACGSADSLEDKEKSDKDTSAISGKSVQILADTMNHELSDTTITITASYAAIACGCPQWFETKFKHIKFLEGVERFYLEPTSKDIQNVNGLWDGEHLPFTVKIRGRFSKEKQAPVTYRTKGVAENARIFWYDKISVLSPAPKSK